MLTIIARTGTVVGEGDGFVTQPLYAAGFAKHRQHSQYVKMVNLSELKVPEGEQKTVAQSFTQIQREPVHRSSGMEYTLSSGFSYQSCPQFGLDDQTETPQNNLLQNEDSICRHADS